MLVLIFLMRLLVDFEMALQVSPMLIIMISTCQFLLGVEDWVYVDVANCGMCGVLDLWLWWLWLKNIPQVAVPRKHVA